MKIYSFLLIVVCYLYFQVVTMKMHSFLLIAVDFLKLTDYDYAYIPVLDYDRLKSLSSEYSVYT